jgi:hypothetical protein
MKRLVSSCCLIALLASPPVHAQPAGGDRELLAGIQHVKEGDFEAAVATLDAVVRRLQGWPDRSKDLAQAALHLGIAHLALDQRDAAKQRFREALAADASLRLTPDQYSPKVIALFDEARREVRPEASRASTSGGGKKWPFILLGAGGAAAAAIAIAAGGGSDPGPVSFSNARFPTPVILCPNGDLDVPLAFSILVDTNNGRTTPLAINASSVRMSIVNSPTLPSEVGFVSIRQSNASPSTIPAGARPSVQVDSTLLCGNFPGDPARFNEWTAVVSLTTSAGVFNLETRELLRVNLP